MINLVDLAQKESLFFPQLDHKETPLFVQIVQEITVENRQCPLTELENLLSQDLFLQEVIFGQKQEEYSLGPEYLAEEVIIFFFFFVLNDHYHSKVHFLLLLRDLVDVFLFFFEKIATRTVYCHLKLLSQVVNQFLGEKLRVVNR